MVTEHPRAFLSGPYDNRLPKVLDRAAEHNLNKLSNPCLYGSDEAKEYDGLKNDLGEMIILNFLYQGFCNPPIYLLPDQEKRLIQYLQNSEVFVAKAKAALSNLEGLTAERLARIEKVFFGKGRFSKKEIFSLPFNERTDPFRKIRELLDQVERMHGCAKAA